MLSSKKFVEEEMEDLEDSEEGELDDSKNVGGS